MTDPQDPLDDPFRIRPPAPTPCRFCGVESVGGLCSGCAKNVADREASEARRKQLAEARRSLPPRGREMRFGGEAARYVPRVAFDTVQAIERLPTSLILRGPSGAGKTTLACAVLNRLIDAGDVAGATPAQLEAAAGCLFSAAYWPAKARAEMPLGKGEAPLIQRCIEASVLVLDDLGHEPVRSSAIPEILFERHHHERPTIVTTKLDPEQIAKRYESFDGEGLARRLHEKGSARVIALANV